MTITHVKKGGWIVCAALLAAALLLSPPEEAGYASSPASLSLGTTLVPEGDDFATRRLGLPWNMQSNPYPDFFTTLKNFDRSKFQVLPGGNWQLDTVNNDPRIWLHWSGVGTTQRVLRMGDTRPIDAGRYRLFSYYMCLDDAPSQQGGVDEDWAAILYWMYDRTPHNDPNNGFTNFILFKQQGFFKNDGDCEVLTFDLAQPSAWAQGSWNNNPNMPDGLRLDPINKPGKSLQIGWARLTTVDTSNRVPITWSNAPAGTVNFYLSLTGCSQNGIKIGYASNPTGSGTFQWGAQLQPGFSAANPLPIPESFEPGQYFIYMRDSNGGIACASSTLTIHEAPILEFQKPSFYSGPDYATVSANDPWGMSNQGDIASYGGMTSPNYNNGVLVATSTGSDPRLFLNINGSINTSQYRYATFRMKINGQNSNGNGWVQRFIWWTLGAGIDSVTTQDLQIYEGWHIYSIDLKTAPAENCSSNCWSGQPTTFRFDPLESPTNTKFNLDFITLTGIDTVIRGNSHNIHYTLPNAAGAQVTFYYDTDTNPSNGRTPLDGLVRGELPLDDPLQVFRAYLPLLLQPGEFDFYAGSLTFVWDTSSTPLNTYYISADVDDGVMTTTWYSELPVTIK